VLSLMLAASGIKIYFQAQEISGLKLEAQAQQTRHAVDIAKKLSNQRKAINVLLVDEEQRRMAQEATNRELVDKVRRLQGYANRLSDALRAYFGGVWARAHSEFGGSSETLPSHPKSLSDGTTTATPDTSTASR